MAKHEWEEYGNGSWLRCRECLSIVDPARTPAMMSTDCVGNSEDGRTWLDDTLQALLKGANVPGLVLERGGRSERAAELRLKTQYDFEQVLDTLATIRLWKVVSYSEDRYTKESDHLEETKAGVYFDLKRKMSRIRQMVFEQGSQGTDETLLDTLGDLAVYAMSGILAISVAEAKKRGVDPYEGR